MVLVAELKYNKARITLTGRQPLVHKIDFPARFIVFTDVESVDTDKVYVSFNDPSVYLPLSHVIVCDTVNDKPVTRLLFTWESSEEGKTIEVYYASDMRLGFYEMKVLRFRDGTVITNPRFLYKIWEGYSFSASHRFEDVADGATVNVLFENPSGSGRKIYVIAIEVVSTGKGRIDIYRNATYSGGTSVPILNLNLGSTISSTANVLHSVTYSGGELAHQTVQPGGTRNMAIGSLAEVGETIVIPEGYNILVTATNTSGSLADISIRIIWWEETIL